MREGARAAPAPAWRGAIRRGAVTSPAPFVGMTRTNNKPSFQRAAVLAERAWAMRASPTPTEQLLWAHIRGRRLGVVFRPQVPLLGLFIADFLAPAQRLVIEVDGAYHGEHARADARRDAALERAGYRVLRSRRRSSTVTSRAQSPGSARRSSASRRGESARPSGFPQRASRPGLSQGP
jgi:very-short-patch-repair endonuclease